MGCASPIREKCSFIMIEAHALKKQPWCCFETSGVQYRVTAGYQVYDRFENMHGKLMLGCWAHARRKFSESLLENNKLATEALFQIQSLYAIEKEADQAEATLEQRKEMQG